VNDELLLALLRHTGMPTTGSPDELLSATLRAFSRIPYENFTKIIAHAELSTQRWKQTPAELIQGFIRYGTGGTCFPLTQTLLHLLTALGYEAAPILADRRYGADTHCAVIVRLEPHSWHLIDPGYMICTPCRLPSSAANNETPLTLRYDLAHSSIELRPTTDGDRIELYTVRGELQSRYRLTYKVTPIEQDTFERAWDRSFDWEMMRYPVLSVLEGDRHIYLQKNKLLIRSGLESAQITLTPEELALELGPRVGIAPEVLQGALKYLNT
jgi:arylamine N-acetyltransferase